MTLCDGYFTLTCHCGTFRIADLKLRIADLKCRIVDLKCEIVDLKFRIVDMKLVDVPSKHRPSRLTCCDTTTYTTWTRNCVVRRVDYVDEANIVNIDEINVRR